MNLTESKKTGRSTMKRILASIIAMSIAISSLAVSASAESEEALQTTVVTEEVTTAPVETEETTVPAETEETTVPAETEETTAPAETVETTVPAETVETTVPVETEETTVPAETEETTVPVETEETTAPVETVETTVPAETEETTAPAETEETTAPAETEETISETEATEEEIAEEVDDKDATTYTSGDFNYTVSNNEATIVGYIGTSASVSIPATVNSYPVVSIENAFNGNTTITNVTIPSGVTTIGKNSFKGCTRLAKVTFPSTVTTIGNASFENCSVLTGITLPSNLTKIDHNAFKNCSKIGSVTFPAKLTFLGNQSFYASGIKAVSLPESLTYFGHGAFAYCDYITSFNFFTTSYDNEYTVLEWGDYYGNNAFDHSSLTTANLNNTHISVIPRGLFVSCSKLQSVTLPSTITAINRDAFNGCSVLSSITIPANVEGIGSYAFLNCSKLGTVTFNAKLKEIGYEAFKNSGIKTVSLPESLTFLGHEAFSYCAYLTKVSFFATSYDDEYTVLEWGDDYGNDGFAHCDSLATVTLNNEHITSIPRGLFYSCPKLTSVTLPNSVTSIGMYAFTFCSALPKITLPANLEEIGKEAFKECKQLATVNFPAKLKTIGLEAFKNSGIKTVSLPESLTFLGHEAFSYCPYLTSVNFYATSYDDEYTILEWGDDYGNDGFAYCNSLTTVKLNNEHITSIPRGLFYSCPKLTSVTLPTSVTSIGMYAFKLCTVLPKLTLPANVETIGYQAFHSCSRLASINFPAKLVSIGDEAFRCSAVKSAYLPESLTYLGAYSFAGCEYLTNVNFYPTSYDDDYTVLQWGDNYGSNAFNGCKSLITAKISPYATTVPSELFYNCTNLRSVTIPAKITNVYSYAFYNCKSFDTIYYTGKTSDWGDVIIETSGNDYFVKADLSYRSVYSPEISSISSKAGDVTITWNALGNVTSYRVYRSTSYAGTKTFLGAVTTNKYTDTSAAGGKTYYYHVQGYNSNTGGKSDYSGAASIAVPVKPAAPTGVKAVSGGGNATITWNAVSNATSYRVFRSTSLTGTRTLEKVRTSTYYIDTNVDTGKTYYYWILAYNANTGLTSAYSASSSVKIVNTFNVTPVINNASVSATKVTLTWNVIPGATSYRIYRRTDSGGRVLLKSQSMTEFTDTGLTKGKIYKYEVRAYSATTKALSSYSALKSARPMAASAITSGNANCKIVWDKNLYATSYRVYRSTSATGAKKLLKAVNNTTYTDTTAVSGTTYYYWVAAYDSVTGSLTGYSNAKIITKN